MHKECFNDPANYSYFTYAQLGLDIKKCALTQRKYPEIYATTGWINFGKGAKHTHENALIMAKKIFTKRNGGRMCLYFVPLYDDPKPFVIYQTEDGEVKLETIGYFNYAKTLFEKFGYDKDFAAIGVIVETKEQLWDIVEV